LHAAGNQEAKTDCGADVLARSSIVAPEPMTVEGGSMNSTSFAMISGLAFASIGIASASAEPIVVTSGTGSAVHMLDAQANFESRESLGHTFVEGGLRFTRVNLSDDNNSCGFAGCSVNEGFAGFTGNYLYGTSANGYLEILAAPGHTFNGLEFVSGSGFGVDSTQFWETYRAGALVGKGSFAFSPGAIVGFSDLGLSDLMVSFFQLHEQPQRC
jgi:hypothetical protein